ncbi:hypothetical protein RRG08_048199 [Elysia crispata]|uniref:Uncharacterized protein n=1 Tax=Elysia crispata TaxID=231223 RepID=A0AAE1A5F5_9GAST|nr:hypothetical protein RRG08_048199 [Elysia crispata]
MCRTRTNGLQEFNPQAEAIRFRSWNHQTCHVLDLTDRSVGDVSHWELIGFRVQSQTEPSVLELEPSNLSCP